MFFNPFPLWFTIFVIIPFRIVDFITYLPYYPLKLIGLGKSYKKSHFIVMEHIEQLTLQPKNYIRNMKGIHDQINKDYKIFVENSEWKKKSNSITDINGKYVQKGDTIVFSNPDISYKVIRKFGRLGVYEDGKFMELKKIINQFTIISR